MLQPQLFQTVKPNFTTLATIVTYQATDQTLVHARRESLESELWQIIASDNEEKLFVDHEQGLWFGEISKTKTGHFTTSKKITKESVEYSTHLNRIMNSPLKKRPTTPTKWGGGIPPITSVHTPTTSPSVLAPILQPQTVQTPTLHDSINQPFEQVQNALNQQQEYNIHFDAHIGSLEVTSQCIDSKIDVLLARIDDNYPTSHKYQCTSSPLHDTLLLPGQVSNIQMHQVHHHHAQHYQNDSHTWDEFFPSSIYHSKSLHASENI
jgi:hypothetical protein